MAKIALRAYTREIEELVDHGQTDEAIAHCKHILNTLPKHIETYRMMGKSYLETQRYGDAADIFQRVLSAVPQDFISHVGMSIIREDEDNKDAAIWHMERGFEVKPSNLAIQGELSRLYGQRDGIEPPKSRLTRGALARMYSQGDFYDQAIAELNAALIDDPKRPDLQVLLAKMYFQAGKTTEAAELCRLLLGKLPYCFEANRILSEILRGSKNSEKAAIYRQRAEAMDPYLAHISGKAPNLESVPDKAVTIDHFRWSPDLDMGDLDKPPAWAASSGGIQSQSAAGGSELPDWLASPAGEDDNGGSSEPIESESSTELVGVDHPLEITSSGNPDQPTVDKNNLPEENTENLPDFIGGAGWEPGSGEEEPTTMFSNGDGSDSEGGLEKAKIPDWLDELKPTSSEEPINSTEGDIASDETFTEEIPDWLNSSSEDSQEGEASPTTSPDYDNLEFLDNLGEATIDEAATPADEKNGMQFENPQAAGAPEASDKDAHDFLQDAIEDPSQEFTLDDELEFLEDLDLDLDINELEPQTTIPSVVGTDQPQDVERGLDMSTNPDEETPDWLSDLTGDSDATPEPAQPKQGQPPADPAGLDMPKDSEEETPDWLSDLSADPAPTSEPAQPPPEQPADQNGGQPQDYPRSLDLPTESDEETPDWLSDLSADPAPASEPVQPPLEQPVDQGAGQPQDDPSGLKMQAESDEETPDWLSDLSADPAPASEPVQPPLEQPLDQAPEQPPTDQAGLDMSTYLTESVEETPDWLSELSADPAPASEPFQASLDQPIPPEGGAQPLDIQPDLETPAVSAEETPDWLSELSAEPAPAVESPPTPQEKFAESETTPAQDPSSEPQLDDEDDAMAWLEGLAVKQGAQEEELVTKPEERKEEAPDWVADSQQQVEEKLTPPAAEKTAPVADEISSPVTEKGDASMDLQVDSPPVIQEGGNEDQPESPITASVDDAVKVPPEESMDWLDSLKIESESEAPLAKQTPEKSTEIISPPPSDPAEQPPEWLKSTDSENLAPMDSESETTEAPPEWLPEISDESLKEEPPEAQPLASKVEDSAEDDSMAWLDDLATEELPSKTTSEVVPQAPVPDQPISIPEPDASNLVSEEVTGQQPLVESSPPGGTKAPDPTPKPKKAKGKGDATFIAAQEALHSGQIEAAVDALGKAIKSGKHLDEIIAEIKSTLTAKPMEVSLWQALGDAYMRADRLQEALESYTKAENLLG